MELWISLAVELCTVIKTGLSKLHFPNVWYVLDAHDTRGGCDCAHGRSATVHGKLHLPLAIVNETGRLKRVSWSRLQSDVLSCGVSLALRPLVVPQSCIRPPRSSEYRVRQSTASGRPSERERGDWGDGQARADDGIRCRCQQNFRREDIRR